MKSSLVSAARGAVLAAATFFPQMGRGQEETPKNPAVAPASAPESSPGLAGQGLALKLPDAKKLAEIPPRIVELAAAKGIDPADIKLESGMWVACKGELCTPIDKALPSELSAQQEKLVLRGLRQGDSLTITGHPIRSHKIEAPDYGIPGLGMFRRQSDGTISFEAYKDFKGTVEFSGVQPRPSAPQPSTQRVDTRISVHKPYSTEYLTEISGYLQDPQMRVVLVVSVPNLCGPCRVFKSDVATAASEYDKSVKLKICTVDFPTFEQARAVMGPLEGGFPAVVVFPPSDGQAQGLQKAPDGGAGPKLPFIPNAGRPYEQRFGRMQSGPLREFINNAVGTVGQTIKGVGGVLMGR